MGTNEQHVDEIKREVESLKEGHIHHSYRLDYLEGADSRKSQTLERYGNVIDELREVTSALRLTYETQKSIQEQSKRREWALISAIAIWFLTNILDKLFV